MQPANERLQNMNKDAYQSVLRALFARNTSNADTVKLMLRLRKELNISSDEHKAWLSELLAARNNGSLATLLQNSLPSARAQQPAGNGWGQRRTRDHSHRGGFRDESEEESDGDGSSYSLELQNARRQGGAGTSYGQQRQQQGGAGARGRPQALQIPGAGGSRGGGGAGPYTPGAMRAPGSASEPAKHLKAKADVAVPDLIGYKVQRYWHGQGGWCEGVVTDFRERDGKYCITYNLGSKKDESMEWFDVALAESIGDPQKSFYNQTHEKIDLRRHSDTRAVQNSSVLNPNKSGKRRRAEEGAAAGPSRAAMGPGGGGGYHHHALPVR